MNAQFVTIPAIPPNDAACKTLQQHVGYDSGLSEKPATRVASRVHSLPKAVAWRKAKRKEEGPLEIVCGWIVQHQIGIAVNLLTLLALTHLCFPRARRHTRKYFELSYYNTQTGQYCAGLNDAFYVFYWVVVFTGLRAAVMDYILTPFARWTEVKSGRDQVRFSEQAWMLIYYSVVWTVGMRICRASTYWYDFLELWTDWPNREIDAVRKWYILVQFAFWLQQMIVINIEKRRKDHWQMFTHHIVTSLLIFTSYFYHQTKVANLILCTMDVVDLIFPAAKCSKYLGFKTLPDILFGLFMTVWVVSRHMYYIMICYSIWAHIPKVIRYGCYNGHNGAISGPSPTPDRFAHFFVPFTDPEGIICWDNRVKWLFLWPLLFLQGILLVWLSMIFKVAYKVLQGAPADDVRSDDEEDDVEHEDSGIEKDLGESQPFEEEVGVEGINFKGRLSNTSKNRYQKSTCTSTGVSLPGHSDRKELLGRIGCDKTTMS